MSGRLQRPYRRWKQLDERVASAGWWIFGWFGVPILATVAIWSSALDIGPAWAAAHGGGHHGVFVARERWCNRDCGLYGDFTSDDGSVRLRHVWWDEPPAGLRPGDTARAIYSGGRQPPVVFRERGSYDWLLIAGFLVGGVVLLVGWGLALYARLTHRSIWAPDDGPPELA